MAAIKITTKQIDVKTGEELEESYEYDGRVQRREDTVYCIYTSIDPDNKIKNSNIIKYKDGNMTRICKGETTSTMNFIPGVETTTNYVTIYGTFPLRFMTNHLECKFNENEITIEVQYLLNISGEPQSQCTMFIHMSGEIE